MVDSLRAGQELDVTQELVAPNGKTHLVMQEDGNLVLYRTDQNPWKPLWASNTWHKPVARAVMQANGNFVCYGGDGHAYWATGTQGHQNADVVLQDDGNLVLYQNGKSLWATNTVQDWNLNDSFTFDTGDAHLDTGEWMHTWASMASGGLISGRTRIWCTIDLRGFHGSVIPMLLDAAGKVIWPPNPQVSKQGPWGVDGVWIGPHDRTIPWAVTSDPAVLGQAKSLTCFQYRDPKNMLLTDLHILGDVVGTVADLIKKVAG